MRARGYIYYVSEGIQKTHVVGEGTYYRGGTRGSPGRSNTTRFSSFPFFFPSSFLFSVSNILGGKTSGTFGFLSLASFFFCTRPNIPNKPPLSVFPSPMIVWIVRECVRRCVRRCLEMVQTTCSKIYGENVLRCGKEMITRSIPNEH